MDDIKNINLYEFLDIPPSAQSREIRKAYRKKALTCHPDKNPDNENAKHLFHQLSDALELLLDDKARAAYDKVLNARQTNEIRNKKLCDERKRFKKKLEEQQLRAEQEHNFRLAQDKLKKEIERLRKEGQKQAEEEAERVREMLLSKLKDNYCSQCRVKITWRADPDDPNNGGYDKDTLHQILSEYGRIEALVISSKKRGSALVEFSTPEGAKTAKLLVTGLPSNPLKLKMIGSDASTKVQEMKTNIKRTNDEPNLFPSFTATNKTIFTHGPSSIDDFEADVLSRLKHAQERKNLIHKLENEKEG